MMESWERFIAAGSRRDLAPADPASVEPRSGNYKRTQFLARPPSALRRWSQGLTFWSPNLRSTGVKPGWGRCTLLVSSVVSRPWLTRREAGMGPMHAGVFPCCSHSSQIDAGGIPECWILIFVCMVLSWSTSVGKIGRRAFSGHISQLSHPKHFHDESPDATYCDFS